MKQIILTACVICLLSCSCTRKTSSGESPEYYSGTFMVEPGGDASFTDCATRIRMALDGGGQYESLWKEYTLADIPDGNTVRIEFHGRLTNRRPLTTDMSIGEIRVDSLLSFEKGAGCLSEFIVAGLYRKIHDGPAEILRLRPDYTYTIETFTVNDTHPVEQGLWYRTSEVTLELKPVNGFARQFQILPVRESISASGGGEEAVYKKEYL